VPSTQNRGYPYPVAADQPDVPADITALAEAVDTDVAAIDAEVATAVTVDYYSTPDPGYPVNTTSTTTEVVFSRITVPSAAYPRVLDISCTQMAQYSQIEAYDFRLYVGSDRIDINRRYDDPQNVFRSSPLHGQYLLPASTAGVVEVRHARAGGTGLVTPSVGAGSYYFQVTARRSG
jgi:hypothetical protein